MAQLENLAEFVHALEQCEGLFNKYLTATIGDLYCEECCGRRRMYARRYFIDGSGEISDEIVRRTPSGYQLTCVQCGKSVLAVIYSGPSGSQLALLRSTCGGGATKHTPKEVAYYLDQAARAQSVGAFSAAVVMYRSALEHLLYEQGFTDGMCNAKIKALEDATAAGTAPSWAKDLDPDEMRVLNRLGNGAVHTNGGDITKQQEIDHDLVIAIALTFESLLELVYERPKRQEERRNRLAAVAAKLR